MGKKKRIALGLGDMFKIFQPATISPTLVIGDCNIFVQVCVQHSQGSPVPTLVTRGSNLVCSIHLPQVNLLISNSFGQKYSYTYFSY